VDEPREAVGGCPDVPDRNVEFGLGAGVDLGHAGEYRTASEWALRTCVFAQTLISCGIVLDYLPVSAEPDRVRYAAVGRALADPKRLCVLESLAIGELSVSDLSTRVGCQVPNMSQHLAVLRRAGLVTSRRDGNTILYRLADARVLEAYRLIQDIAR
jgi:DNA-binding transcriptional ArsR family regulator